LLINNIAVLLCTLSKVVAALLCLQEYAESAVDRATIVTFRIDGCISTNTVPEGIRQHLLSLVAGAALDSDFVADLSPSANADADDSLQLPFSSSGGNSDDDDEATIAVGDDLLRLLAAETKDLLNVCTMRVFCKSCVL
jgi:hypothetical protein